jgi:hypothetical protein
MFLSHLVEIFFRDLKAKVFFLFENFFQKNRFFGQIFEILQGVLDQLLATPYEELER